MIWTFALGWLRERCEFEAFVDLFQNGSQCISFLFLFSRKVVTLPHVHQTGT